MDTLLPTLRVPLPAPGGALDPRALFAGTAADVWLEIGFGSGEHLAAQARARPDIGLIGCEPFVNGVAGLLALVERDGLANVRVFDDDARLLLDCLAGASIGRVFMLFADPWPKKRHAKRRILAGETLDRLADAMADDAELRFASDDSDFVAWTVEKMIGHAAFAWPERGPEDGRRRPADACETRYEAKARAAGRTCFYLTFRRRPRGRG